MSRRETHTHPCMHGNTHTHTHTHTHTKVLSGIKHALFLLRMWHL